MREATSHTLGAYERRGDLELGRGDVISTGDLAAYPGDYPVYSSSAVGDGVFGRYGRHMFDEELITWSIDGGGRPFHRRKHRFSVTNVCGFLRIKRPDRWDYGYLHAILEKLQSGIQFDYQMKAHPSVIRDLYRFDCVPIDEQRAIAELRDTLDTTIRQTEAIIEKLQQVKQGLLHDLLTRGIDTNGELRPPQNQAPHLYKDSLLGWIPRGWELRSVDQISDSVVDGPFGSNLKTEHYVPVPGVRVVRLQNIGIGDFDDNERAYVSESKAGALSKNQVVGGDVLVAALGDERYPVGRACCYPAELPAAVNKADCFRQRPRKDIAIGPFVMRSLNGAAARRQVRGFEQGVTMQRVNLSNLRKVVLSMPLVAEQQLICERVDALDRTLATNMALMSKLREQKSGLMDDLLTGRVRVTPLLDIAAPA
ncbi:restriction endonuclease subunit S [Methyloversatilis sp. XJ19-13]|uniref:restriction endonuclease subunit S n=1 Tax=Methyloversatilis sp. XJ19-13 TaxID=2963430 RepID=UPI00211C9978|nr:restriction endonuclease subunit S [Methyloversatilis sp. XJ19-13]MCQ9374431.1 restriction endonuclease subunit S [Methyloversatilis sp. XJ19-13]